MADGTQKATPDPIRGPSQLPNGSDRSVSGPIARCCGRRIATRPGAFLLWSADGRDSDRDRDPASEQELPTPFTSPPRYAGRPISLWAPARRHGTRAMHPRTAGPYALGDGHGTRRTARHLVRLAQRFMGRFMCISCGPPLLPPPGTSYREQGIMGQYPRQTMPYGQQTQPRASPADDLVSCQVIFRRRWGQEGGPLTPGHEDDDPAPSACCHTPWRTRSNRWPKALFACLRLASRAGAAGVAFNPWSRCLRLTAI